MKKLTGKTSPTDRYLDFETLVKYKVGIGKEEFVSPDGTLSKIPVIYFPMFKLVSKEQQSGTSTSSATGSEDEEGENPLALLDSIQTVGTTISTSTCKLVKCKIRGIGKANKKYMRMMPAGSGR